MLASLVFAGLVLGAWRLRVWKLGVCRLLNAVKALSGLSFWLDCSRQIKQNKTIWRKE